MALCSRATSSGVGPPAPSRPSVVEIFRRHVEAYRGANPRLTPEQERLLRDVMVCRTAALGGHLYVCDSCSYELPVYNSCRNRNCPNCQALDQARWIEARKARVLPVGHHHVVFTLPGQLRPLAKRYPRTVFGLLQTAVRETLTILPREHLGLQFGVTAVLHTWTRELLFHPHVHCIVTAGGLTLDGTRWVDRKGFLLPVALMKAYFRGRVLHHLGCLRDQGDIKLGQAAWNKLIGSLPKPKQWCIYIQQPFGRSDHVLEYLGRYTRTGSRSRTSGSSRSKMTRSAFALTATTPPPSRRWSSSAATCNTSFLAVSTRSATSACTPPRTSGDGCRWRALCSVKETGTDKTSHCVSPMRRPPRSCFFA